MFSKILKFEFFVDFLKIFSFGFITFASFKKIFAALYFNKIKIFLGSKIRFNFFWIGFCSKNGLI